MANAEVAQRMTDLERDGLTLSQEQINTPISFEDAMKRAGLTENDAIVGSAFELVEKDELLSVPFIVIELQFGIDGATQREYVISRCVLKDGRMVVFTDGGTGYFETIKRHVNERIRTGEPAFEGYYVKQGLRVSEYPVGKDGTPLTKQQIAQGVRPDSMGKTFYVA